MTVAGADSAGLASEVSGEGLWPPHSVPIDALNRRFGLKIDSDWVDRVRLGTVKLYSTNSTSCGSAAVVSPDGLVLTCHHCVASSLVDASTPARDLLANGWLARRREDEIKCDSRIADVLIGSEDVTTLVREAVAQESTSSSSEALAQIEATRQQALLDAGVNDEVIVAVSLHGGAEYWLYRYRRYTDIRLVFAPESAVAAFGGDVDNLKFPRWCFDVALVRLYRDGVPARTLNYLPVRFTGASCGIPVIMSGNPMPTDRGRSVAELDFKRRFELPRWLLLASELRGRYVQYAQSGADAARSSMWTRVMLENWIKIKRLQLDALLDPQFWHRLTEAEEGLRQRVTASALLPSGFGDPWAEVSQVQARRERLNEEYALVEIGIEWAGQLARHARVIVRGATERRKDINERQREYSDSGIHRFAKALSVPATFDSSFEALQLQFWLERLQEWLGPRHPLVATYLMQEPLDRLAARVIAGSNLQSASERMRLWEGGLPAVQASSDPLLALLGAFEPFAVSIRDRNRVEVEAPLARLSESIAIARATVDRTTRPPDATATIRLSPGRVEGWTEYGEVTPHATRLGELFTLATGAPPFNLPEQWLSARCRIEADTPLNVLSSTDVMPGNSGSPLLDANAHVVATVFDGNQYSMSGSFALDASRSRTISVDLASLAEVLDKVYDARELLDELHGRSQRASSNANSNGTAAGVI